MAVSVTAMNTLLGAYNRDKAMNFVKTHYVQLESLKYFQKINVKGNQAALIRMERSGHFRPSTKNGSFSTNGTSTLHPRILTTYAGKIDDTIYPEAMEDTFIGDLMDKTNKTSLASFEAWLLEEMKNGLMADIEQSCIWQGVRNASGTTAADVTNGLFKIINDAIASTNASTQLPSSHNITSIGALTSADAFDQVRAFISAAKALNPAIIQKKMKLFMSVTSADYYDEDYNSQFANATYTNQFGQKVVRGNENVEIVPTVGFGDSTKMVLTEEKNLVFGTPFNQTWDSYKFEAHHRQLDIMFDSEFGVDFADPRVLFLSQEGA